MASDEDQHSLYHFIEQMAKTLRSYVRLSHKKKKYSKKSVSAENKIAQIAKMLRTEVHKKNSDHKK